MNFIEENWSNLLLVIFLVLVTYLSYILYLKPLALYEYYLKRLNILNYKTYVYPFKFLNSGLIQKMVENTKNHKDALYTLKRDYPQKQVALMNLFNKIVIEIFDPDLIKEYFIRNSEGYYVKAQLGTRNAKRIMGKGLLFIEGENWKIRRKTISQVFNFQFIKNIIPTIAQISFEKYQKYDNKIQAKKSQLLGKVQNQSFNLLYLFSDIFSAVIVKCFFGSQPIQTLDGEKSIVEILNQLFKDLLKQTRSFTGLAFGPRFWRLNITDLNRKVNKSMKIIKEFAMKLVNKRVQQIKKNGPKQKQLDIIEALIKCNLLVTQQNQVSETRGQYSYEQLIQQFITFFVSGEQTNANLETAMVYNIVSNSDVQTKLRQQIQQHFPGQINPCMFNYQKINALEYLSCVQNQTLRMFGPVPSLFNRTALKDHYLGKIPIKAGTEIRVNSIGNHFKEEYYSDPLAFKPQRWLKNKDKPQSKYQNPYQFMAFSAGSRNCIGKNLAIIQSKIATIIFFKKYSKIQITQEPIITYGHIVYSTPQLNVILNKKKSIINKQEDQ